MFKHTLAYFMAAGALFANSTFYATQEKPVYLDAESKKVAGKLLPTNAIQVTQETEGRVKFRIEGYQNPEAKNVIYFTDKARIFSLAFSKSAKPNVQIIKEKESKGGWNKVFVEAYTTKEHLVEELEPLYKKAQSLYSDNCSMCHSLHEVDHYTANQWPSTFRSMLERTPIEKNDVWLVIQYLQKNASDMK